MTWRSSGRLSFSSLPATSDSASGVIRVDGCHANAAFVANRTDSANETELSFDFTSCDTRSASCVTYPFADVGTDSPSQLLPLPTARRSGDPLTLYLPSLR